MEKWKKWKKENFDKPYSEWVKKWNELMKEWKEWKKKNGLNINSDTTEEIDESIKKHVKRYIEKSIQEIEQEIDKMNPRK